MTMLTRALRPAFALLLGGFACVAAASSVVAASVKGQPPCVGPGGYCLLFDATDTIPVIRGINFAAPKAGTAAVTFHGSLFCGGLSTLMSSAQLARVDFVSQIVDRQNMVPDRTKAGSLRHKAGSALVANSPYIQWSTTFNLASTRLFAVDAAGTQKYYFKIARLLQDPNITCHVYNAAFSVLFTP